jgi:hypothetical protein
MSMNELQARMMQGGGMGANPRQYADALAALMAQMGVQQPNMMGAGMDVCPTCGGAMSQAGMAAGRPACDC